MDANRISPVGVFDHVTTVWASAKMTQPANATASARLIFFEKMGGPIRVDQCNDASVAASARRAGWRRTTLPIVRRSLLPSSVVRLGGAAIGRHRHQLVLESMIGDAGFSIVETGLYPVKSHSLFIAAQRPNFGVTPPRS